MTGLAKFRLEISGLGIVLIGGDAAAGIEDGHDYFSQCLTDPDVAAKIFSTGLLAGFGTGSPGVFIVDVILGELSPEEIMQWCYRLTLPFFTTDGSPQVRDLYDFMCWDRVNSHPSIYLGAGNYAATIVSSLPVSGIRGDGQRIAMYFKKVEALPPIHLPGLPYLG